MKKIMILLLFILIIFFIKGDNFCQETDLNLFLINHNLSYENISPYLQYQSFSYENYFAIEEIRQKNNCSHLMALNKFKYQDIHPAILKNTFLILVNKQFYLDKKYKPDNLVNPHNYGVNTANDDVLIPKNVLLAYLQMISHLKLANLYIYSGYRTYEKQEALYNYYHNDNYSAEPGFSEHQTGLALDISTLNYGLTEHFANSKEYKLLINNCYKFGFILRYPQGKEKETGYFFEPWHFRYVGIKHATMIMKNNLTLETYIFENFEI